MPLIIEDGTKPAGANSYVTDEEYTAYAALRGYEIGSDEATRESELIKATDYLDKYRDKFKGVKSTRDQSLSWPRYNVVIDGYSIDHDEIPTELKRAQMELAKLSVTVDLTPSGSIQNVASQKLVDLSVSYHDGGSWAVVQHGAVDLFLNALIVNSGQLRTLRI